MNALQVALVNSGLAKKPRRKKFKPRVVNCRKCGHPMETHENTNIMACSNCSAYFIFDNDKDK